MSTAEMRPEPDRITGARHPRDTVQLFGQTAAERSFLTAFNTNRLHHGWLIHGPRGIGKATLAWSIARFLLATSTASAGGMFGDDIRSPEVLNIARDHPVVQRIRVGSESGLFVLRRPYDEKRKRLKQQITIDEVRKLKKFFALSATDGGRRVVIVDAADDMNTNAANAILKVLEEPPEHCCLLLISHQPARLLPTLRSRCWDLRLQPLSPAQMTQALQQTVEYTASDPKIDDFTPIWTNQTAGRSEALAELSSGSVGVAIRLLHREGLALYGDLVALFCDL
ncbi:MAG: DNA polymerase III subunit delta', partial [Paracoccaceae bacterium]|nr:DNA polymerase III subunit delta' [Paracoccaceae bacterium]